MPTKPKPIAKDATKHIFIDPRFNEFLYHIARITGGRVQNGEIVGGKYQVDLKFVPQDHEAFAEQPSPYHTVKCGLAGNKLWIKVKDTVSSKDAPTIASHISGALQ